MVACSVSLSKREKEGEQVKYQYRNAIVGVYQIKNLVSGKSYIGSSNIIQKRWTQHRRELRAGIHFNPKLQNAWNKYGEENFKFMNLGSKTK
jgi:hypothetical protein